MATRFSPFKPKVIKRDGSWGFIIPTIVFGALVNGEFKGPAQNWEHALVWALQMSKMIYFPRMASLSQSVDLEGMN